MNFTHQQHFEKFMHKGLSLANYLILLCTVPLEREYTVERRLVPVFKIYGGPDESQGGEQLHREYGAHPGIVLVPLISSTCPVTKCKLSFGGNCTKVRKYL